MSYPHALACLWQVVNESVVKFTLTPKTACHSLKVMSATRGLRKSSCRREGKLSTPGIFDLALGQMLALGILVLAGTFATAVSVAVVKVPFAAAHFADNTVLYLPVPGKLEGRCHVTFGFAELNTLVCKVVNASQEGSVDLGRDEGISGVHGRPLPFHGRKDVGRLEHVLEPGKKEP